MKKILYIDMNELADAIKSKDRFEALAFSVCVKLNFQNSIIYNISIRNLKAFFGIGQTRLSRILKNAKEYGYIQEKYGKLSACKLKSEKALNYRLVFDFNTYKLANKGKSVFRLKDIMDCLRKHVVLNYVNQQNFKENINKTLSSRDADYCNLKKYRKAVKLRNKKYMNLKKSNDYVKHNAINRYKFARVANCSKTKVKRLIDEMCADKMIERTTSMVETDLKRDRFNMQRANEILGTAYIPCYLRSVKGENNLYLQLSNIYVNRFSSVYFIR